MLAGLRPWVECESPTFTGAMGVPTLDGLGVLGGGGHTLEEYIVVDSLVRRGRLMAGLLASLGESG